MDALFLPPFSPNCARKRSRNASSRTPRPLAPFLPCAPALGASAMACFRYTEAEKKKLFGDYKPFAAGGLDVTKVFGLEEESWKEESTPSSMPPSAHAPQSHGLAQAYASAYEHQLSQLKHGSPTIGTRAKEHWAHVRHCERMRHVLAQNQWSRLLQAAIHENDSALQEASLELEASKGRLAAVNVYLQENSYY